MQLFLVVDGNPVIARLVSQTARQLTSVIKGQDPNFSMDVKCIVCRSVEDVISAIQRCTPSLVSIPMKIVEDDDGQKIAQWIESQSSLMQMSVATHAGYSVGQAQKYFELCQCVNGFLHDGQTINRLALLKFIQSCVPSYA